MPQQKTTILYCLWCSCKLLTNTVFYNTIFCSIFLYCDYSPQMETVWSIQGKSYYNERANHRIKQNIIFWHDRWFRVSQCGWVTELKTGYIKCNLCSLGAVTFFSRYCWWRLPDTATETLPYESSRLWQPNVSHTAIPPANAVLSICGLK